MCAGVSGLQTDWEMALVSPAVSAALGEILALLVPSPCAEAATEFQSEGRGRLLLKLHLHMKHGFHVFIPGVGKFTEIRE